MKYVALKVQECNKPVQLKRIEYWLCFCKSSPDTPELVLLPCMVNKLNVLQIHQPDQTAAGSFLAAIPTKKA